MLRNEEPESQETVSRWFDVASSLGLSFTVPTELDIVRVTASWGAYWH